MLSSIVNKLKPTFLGASLICVRILLLNCGSPEFCKGQQDVDPVNARSNLSGTWQQNNERSIPPPRNKSHIYKMTVEASDKVLRVRITANNGQSERNLDLTYQIGGKELVYKLQGLQVVCDGHKVSFGGKMIGGMSPVTRPK